MLHRILMGSALSVTMLAAVAGCAKSDWIDRTLVTVDVTGTWHGTMMGGGGTTEIWLELKQEGPKLGGTVRGPLSRSTVIVASGPVEGTVGGDRVEFRQTNGDLRAELTVTGDEMNGLAYRAGGSHLIYLKRTGSVPPSGSQPAKE